MSSEDTVIDRIDLGVLAGEEHEFLLEGAFGELLRKKADLDRLDRTPGIVEVHIPDTVLSISSEFVRKLLRPSIDRLGEEGFRNKYVFTGEDYRTLIEQEIVRAVRDLPAGDALAQSTV
jgi:hypothetical protein